MITTEAFGVTELLSQPFNLDSNFVWLLEISIPMVIALAGWLFVYLLNVKNMKIEKAINVKIQAYDHLKSDINELIQSFGLLNSHMFIIFSTLENFTPDYSLYDINKKRLLEDLDNSVFKNLYNKANNDFIKFIFSWELYEIVLKKLVKQRYALQCEFDGLLSEASGVIPAYESYLSYVKANLDTYNNSTNDELVIRIKAMHNSYTDFNACIRDVNLNIQDFVFEDILKDKNEKRKVKNANYLTIDTLLIKHKNKLEEFYS